MNHNVILTVLELKGLITREEAELLADFIANSPQPTYYSDAFETIKNIIDPADPLVRSGEVQGLVGQEVQPILTSLEAHKPVEPKTTETPKSDHKVKKSTDKKTK